MRLLPQILQSAAILGLLASCASSGSQAEKIDVAGRDAADLEAEAQAAGIRAERSPVRVSLRDHRTGVTIGLLNQSHTELSDFYSQVRNAPTYKVIPDLDMGALVTQLEEFGFFTQAQNASRVPGSRVTVQVDRGGRLQTLAYGATASNDEIELVQKCSTAVRAVYNLHQAYQVVENAQGDDYFQNETQRLARERESQNRP